MRFVESSCRFALAAAVLLTGAVSLAGCGASVPQQVARSEPERVAPAAPVEKPPAQPVAQQAEPPAAAVASVKKAHRDRRHDRDANATAAAEPSEPAVAETAVPAEVQAAFEHALAAVRAENWVQAELELEQLVQSQPEYPGPLVNLAIVYLHDGRAADARKTLDRALQIDPAFPAANDELGVLLRQAGDFAGAERAYRRALDGDPSYSLAHYNLGVLLDVYLRRPEEALEQYELYQSSLSAPDQTVGRWIVDLRRRTGSKENVSSVAQEDGP